MASEAGVFALRAGVGLHADGVKAGDGFQLFGQAVDHRQVAGGVFARGKRVQAGEFRPGDRDHLAGGVPASWCSCPARSSVIQRQVAVCRRLR